MTRDFVFVVVVVVEKLINKYFKGATTRTK